MHPVVGPGTLERSSVTYEGTGGDVIAAPAAGKRLYLLAVHLTTDAADKVKLWKGTDTTGNRVLGGFYQANGGIDRVWPIEAPYALPAATKLAVNSVGGAANLVVTVEYLIGPDSDPST